MERSWLARTLILVSMTSLATGEPSSGQATETDSQRLAKLQDTFYNWRLKESPEYASKYGNHKYDGQLERYTEEIFQSRMEFATILRQHLGDIKEANLSKQDRYSLYILRDLLTTFTNGFAFRKYGAYNAYDPIKPPIKEWKTLVTWMQFETIDDYDKLLSLYEAIARQVDEQIELMKESIRLNTTNSAASLDYVVHLIEREIDVIVNHTEESVFVKPLMSIPLTIPAEVRTNLTKKGRNAVTNILLPALQKLKYFLQEPYTANTRQHIGVSSMENGTEYYRRCLKWHLSLDLTARQVHDIGRREVARIATLTRQVMNQQDAGMAIRLFMNHLRDQPDTYYTNTTDLLDDVKRKLDLVRGKLTQVVHKVPAVKLLVDDLGDPFGIAGFYADPSSDGSRPAVYYVNSLPLKDRPKFGFDALTLHEAIPGHHLQTGYALESNIPDFRRLIEFRKYYAVPFNWPFQTAYIEGWALYAEYLGEEIDAYTEPHSMFGRYASEIHRAARLVVDTGIHAFGWSRQQAFDYLYNHTALSPSVIRAEISRYIALPGQACAYKIGEMKILELRKLASERLGDAFDKRDFHEAILTLGPAPLTILQDYIKEWIEDTLTLTSGSTGVKTGHSVVIIVFITILCVVFAT